MTFGCLGCGVELQPEQLRQSLCHECLLADQAAGESYPRNPTLRNFGPRLGSRAAEYDEAAATERWEAEREWSR